MAVCSCIGVEPIAAAKFDIPLMAVTESSNPTPAVVNNPIARVMSPKLYLVKSAYSFSSSKAPVTSPSDLSVFTMIVRVDFS